jgi:hypothetical protein
LKSNTKTSQITTTQTILDEELSSVELLEKYSKAKVQYCDITKCPYPNICSATDTCSCYWSFLNYNEQGTTGDVACSYEQKKQSFAFFWEFNFGAFSVGHFYSGRTLYGVLKLLLNLAPCLISCIIMCFGGGFDALKESSWKIIINCGFCCACLGIQIYDLIAFGNNWHKDGNDMPLAPWDFKY